MNSVGIPTHFAGNKLYLAKRLKAQIFHRLNRLVLSPLRRSNIAKLGIALPP